MKYGICQLVYLHRVCAKPNKGTSLGNVTESLKYHVPHLTVECSSEKYAWKRLEFHPPIYPTPCVTQEIAYTYGRNTGELVAPFGQGPVWIRNSLLR